MFNHNDKELNGISSNGTDLKVQIEMVNGQIIDVREPYEYEESHAIGAVNIPLGNILDGDYEKIDQSRPVYVYCRSGVRAGEAKVALENAGYTNVTNLGGLNDWISQKGEVCSSTEPTC